MKTKTMYNSPEITVEELTKVDVLCASAENDENSPDNGQKSLLDLGSWWD